MLLRNLQLQVFCQESFQLENKIKHQTKIRIIFSFLQMTTNFPVKLQDTVLQETHSWTQRTVLFISTRMYCYLFYSDLWTAHYTFFKDSPVFSPCWNKWQVFILVYTPDCKDAYRQKYVTKQTKSICRHVSKGLCCFKL